MDLRIKEIQQKKGITNVELSKLTGIGAQQISYYHTGDRKPPLKTLEVIANALNVDPIELIETGLDFAHFYDDKTGEWLGVRKK